jgi:hypothetical protein
LVTVGTAAAPALTADAGAEAAGGAAILPFGGNALPLPDRRLVDFAA